MSEDKAGDVEVVKQRSGGCQNDSIAADNVAVNNGTDANDDNTCGEVVRNMGKGTDGDDVVTESKQDVVQDSSETVNNNSKNEEVKNGNMSGEVKNKGETGNNVNPLEPGSNKELAKETKPKVTVNAATGKSLNANPLPQTLSKLKKMKKGIFVSYSPDAGFLERKFVVETTRQLKENNLAEDIWFDKDEKNTDSPCWFSFRMEAVERCRAAILFLSESYFSCPVSVYEGKALIERQKTDPNSVKLFPIHFSTIDMTDIPKQFNTLIKQSVNLTGPSQIKLSLAEKTSIVIGEIMEDLEKFATMNAPPTMANAPDMEFTGEYKNKKICQWNVNDLQEWLFKLGIKEFYRQSLAENMVDGFLLMSLTDNDMVNYLGIDSRAVRKKIMQQILHTLDKEHKQSDNWHLRARGHRAKPDIVYLIYDPADVRLSQNLKADLKKKGLQVIHHDAQKLGRSKEEFLQINGPQVASATHVIVIFTEAAAVSPFVFHEVLFADWLGKKLVTAMFKNIWTSLRVSLKAVLGDCPAIDFETKMYTESLDVLEHHIKPLRRVPGVVLEQAYLNKMADGLKPLELLATTRNIKTQRRTGDVGRRPTSIHQLSVGHAVQSGGNPTSPRSHRLGMLGRYFHESSSPRSQLPIYPFQRNVQQSRQRFRNSSRPDTATHEVIGGRLVLHHSQVPPK
ncbi:uncharacterized protein LOC121374871 isoform X2 [Gigantopelta aegis]|uniref:uncharacterized protein LOC121374871 isoform X2 n=1 Tax=Gigantopelta aegis TaxID=1735272 RepID=UPI001B88CA9C|nr:uncharacterized protein LOC121374871 isoform X2 [Gigantopelta aegis]